MSVTASAGLGDPRWGASAAWIDHDGDGDIDLVAAQFGAAMRVRCHQQQSLGRQLVLLLHLFLHAFAQGDQDADDVGALVDASAEIGQEIFEVDAGWYQGTPYSPYADMRNTWPAISSIKRLK
mgnify:CR=1 FL=1